jgi:hypothetical protein
VELDPADAPSAILSDAAQKREAAQPTVPPPTRTEILLEEIRDRLPATPALTSDARAIDKT